MSSRQGLIKTYSTTFSLLVLTLLCLTPNDFTCQKLGRAVNNIFHSSVFHHVVVDSTCDVLILLVTRVRVLWPTSRAECMLNMALNVRAISG